VRKVLEALGLSTASWGPGRAGRPMTGEAAYSEDVPVLFDTQGILVQGREQVEPVSDTHCVNCGECVRACRPHSGEHADPFPGKRTLPGCSGPLRPHLLHRMRVMQLRVHGPDPSVPVHHARQIRTGSHEERGGIPWLTRSWYIVSHAPYWHNGSSITAKSHDMLLAALPAVLMGIYQYGVPALRVIAFAISSAMLWELLLNKA